MTASDFTITVFVDQTPEEVFSAINNVRGWWSEEIEGGTEKLHDEFKYHYKDVHQCKIKLIEVIPGKKVVWLVMDNYFSFTKDKSEWKNTKISFEISKKGNQTQIQFTHHGLVPQYECYDICRDAWTNYINNSLCSLITTGKGEPNPKEGGFNEWLLDQYSENKNEQKMKRLDFNVSITVDAAPHEAFKAINSVTKWWTENLEGGSQKLNDEFTVRFGDVHYSKQKLVEVVPNKKVVWLVTESRLNFIKDKDEWTNTKIVFEIFTKNKQTQISFTHMGLVPEIECYRDCSNAWGGYITNSLRSLITTGRGKPEPKEG